MDGRKTVGGKLELKIRVRNPILAKQIEQINEKWLIIDAWIPSGGGPQLACVDGEALMPAWRNQYSR